MRRTELTERLEVAEGYLLQGEDDAALELLSRLAEDAEEYVDRNYPTGETDLWACFPSRFELVSYVRTEGDARTLHDVGEPFDRLYADLAQAQVSADDYDAAIKSMQRAVRWRPMNCAHLLDLADLYRMTGDDGTAVGFDMLVLPHASDARHLARAYADIAGFMAKEGRNEMAAAALRAGRSFGVEDARLAAALEQAKGTDRDPDSLDDARAEGVLAEAGIAYGANVEVVACLLACALDAAAAGDDYTATNLTLRARDLVGTEAVKSLVRAIREDEVS